ncbi:uncharacterized protein CC84DRAFT_1232946 [Paraphaeosphaeria sporulosa]|uniref:Uncharacterized protein n=1 Tax=Paraphaeosphaeria sporulosa TaxID=1460663 RepID=A0A177BYM2_9PLEO|nr:uncharacterized protein CC84DRAFT_1232946 [Paraphaeosphaeria sporulosa]OAF99439.1 hypothetical protein CC84DRAFT_1232946 [Paraphaeosphaeria sporulosa]
MGNSSSSHPQPPLIALNGGSLGRHNTISVPAEAFAGKRAPEKWCRLRGKSNYTPNYRPVFPDPWSYLPFPPPRVGRRPWGRRGWRGGGEETLSEGDMSMRPRRRGRGGVGRMRGAGMGLRRGGEMNMDVAYVPGMHGVVPLPMVYPYDAQGARARSAPNLQQAGYMSMPVPVPMPVRRGRVKKGVNPTGGVQPGVLPHYAPVRVNGMAPGPAPSPYAAQAQPLARMPARAPPPQQQKMRHPHPPGVEAVANGVHFAHPSSQRAPVRRKPSAPHVSAQLNRTQPPSKRAGPSGQEWLPSDNAFLDACTCTTNCNCRKGVRVLYRQQGQGDGEGAQNVETWGEIRYVLKDDLGRDCGDSGRCRADGEGDSGGGGRRKGKGKGKKGEGEQGGEVDKMREELKGLRQDIRKMRLGGTAMGPGMSMARMPSPRAWPGMEMDPRMSQRIGAGDPYDMDFTLRMQQQQMMGRRPGRMPGRMAGIDLDDERSFPDAEYMLDPMMHPDMPRLPPHLRNPGARRPKQRRGPPGRLPPRRAPDFDPHMEYAPHQGRRGNMPMPLPRRRGGGAPPPPPGYHFDDESMGSGLDGRGRFGPMDDDEGNWAPRPGKPFSELGAAHPDRYTTGIDNEFNMAPPPPPGQSPRGRGRESGSEDRPEGRRPNQAYVDDGDDY